MTEDEARAMIKEIAQWLEEGCPTGASATSDTLARDFSATLMEAGDCIRLCGCPFCQS